MFVWFRGLPLSRFTALLDDLGLGALCLLYRVVFWVVPWLCSGEGCPHVGSRLGVCEDEPNKKRTSYVHARRRAIYLSDRRLCV